jgi:membrane protein implicated in regulation of membrane protease activity
MSVALYLKEPGKFEMKAKFPLVRVKRIPLSRKKYRLIMIALWLYTAMWILILIFMHYWGVSYWIKLPIYFLLIVGTPSLSDLIKPYERYEKEWQMQQEAARNIIRSGVGAEGMILKTGTVIKKCDPEGKVRIGNETWRALAIDKSELDIGVTVIVRDITGMTLIVEKKSSQGEESGSGSGARLMHDGQ